jgi:SAM-dependent methyltransferase
MDANNTERSFKDKWDNNRDLAFSDTQREDSDIGSWILGRNGWKNHAGLKAFLAGKKRVLDGGCGNGRVTALLCTHRAPGTEVMGIDLVAADVARKNLKEFPNVTTRQKDLLADLSDLGQFDFIYCQEVLHHTNDPAGAFKNLCGRLAPGGEIAIYVYKVKAPIREFTDDFVRGRIAAMPYAEAMDACREITELGRVLSETTGKVTVPGVKVLGIEAGEYDVQRFIYHFFAKIFWNPALSHEDNTAINYDWYHPQNCTRHTPEEIRGWFRENGLDVTQECVDHYGITMRGRRTAAV